jgi:signal transduction histidine kinase
MPENDFLIYHRRAGARHVRVALGFAFILALACAAVYPYRLVQLPRIPIFIPVIDTMHFLFSGIIAAVLLSLASILRSRALVALGTGYAVVGLIAVVHALTYPDTFSHTGLLGAGPYTVSWLYTAWHTALPAAIIAYTQMKDADDRQKPPRAPARTIFFCLLLAVIVAAVTTWLATREGAILARAVGLEIGQFSLLQYPLMVLFMVTLALLWRGEHSILDYCLMLTLWAWLLEAVILPGAARFSVGWYTGRVMGLVSGVFVLGMLLIEMTRLYARTVVLVTAQKRERENRQLLGEAVGAYITHELRQPLAAISLNAYTGQQLSKQAGGELSAVMHDLVRDAHRANEIIESTKAIFETAPGQRRATDINQLIRDTLLLTQGQLDKRAIQVALKLEDHLPLVMVNPMQMQQVFLNLFMNAAEALGAVADGARYLRICSESGDAAILIRVENNGPGIGLDDRDQIFDLFFTTKEHGMGMGLSICRSVLIAHGGTIQVEAVMPSGVRFEILLPNDGAQLAPA